jgi:ribulose-phosphate 3-epimerase
MKYKDKIIPAIIAKTQKEFDERISKVMDFVDLIQLDFMDGKFVPNKSIDFDFKLQKTKCNFEAHLMMKNPERWIEKNYMKVDTILAHFESCDDPLKIIDLVKSKKKRMGFVLNPETSARKIEKYLDDLDQVLIMTVNPGFYGSPFLPEMIDKISELRGMKTDLDIEVDGGITPETIYKVYNAGANMFVSGSYIVNAANVQMAIEKLKGELH